MPEGEGHSRETFEAAEHELAEAKDDEKEVFSESAHADKPEYITPERAHKLTERKSTSERMMNDVKVKMQEWGDMLGVTDMAKAWDRTEKAEKILKNMMAEGKAEAVGLNEKYETLKQEAADALKAIDVFEREELGMHSAVEDSEAA